MTACAFCGAGAVLRWSRHPESFALCPRCSVVFRWPVPTQRAADYHAAIAGESGWEAQTPRHVLDAYARYVARRLRPIGRVLDFGTGTGEFVKALRAQGIEAHGVEPSCTARDVAMSRDGLSIAASSAALPSGGWRGATAIEVAEHIPDPGWLAELYSVLDPGAFLLLTTPNRDSLAASLRGAAWSQMTNPFHVVLFNAVALRGVMRRAGFVNVHLLRTGPVFGRTAVHKAAHCALALAGRHSSLRVLGYKPTHGVPCA